MDQIRTAAEHQEKAQVIAFLIKDFLSPLQVRSAVNEDICRKVTGTAKILHKLVQNALKATNGAVLDTATVDMYRKVKLSNKVINEKVVKVQGAVDLLTAVGFAYDESDGEKYLIFVPDSNNVALANFACMTIQEDLTRFQQKEKEAQKTKKVPSKADYDKNVFLSEKERKERRMKALKAKKAEKEARERAILRWNEDKCDRIEAKERKQNAKKKALLTVANESIQSSTNTKIRKLSTPGSVEKVPASLPSSNNPEELLQSLREKAQAEWQKKHGMDIDVKDDDMGAKEPTLPHSNMNHYQDENITSSMSAAKLGAELILNSHEKMLVDYGEGDLSPSWTECLKNIARVGPAQKIRDTSVFYKASEHASTYSSSPKCFRRLFTEFDELKSSLPSDKECSAWLRFDEETPQYLRALLTAPLPGPSPYAGGVFCFDIFVPDNYPMVSPKVNIVTTGQGTVRFGPNLYADGKVCLSLLGTWQGPKWDPKHSSLYQVLVSIQSLVLGVEHPYYLEPSYGGWEEEIKEGDFATVGHTLKGDVVREEMKLPSEVWQYEDTVRIGTIRYAMIEPLLLASKNGKSEMKPSAVYLLPFEDVIKAHFYHNKSATLASVASWLNASRPPSLYASNPNTFPSLSNNGPHASGLSSTLLDILQELYLKLQSSIDQVCRPIFVKESLKNAAVVGDDFSKDMPHSGKLKTAEEEPKRSDIDRLRDQMEEAAQKSNFILAGQLQNEIRKIQELESKVNYLGTKIKEAAEKGDYINAGKFQTEINALQEEFNGRKISAFNSPESLSNHSVVDNQVEEELDSAMNEDFEGDDMDYNEYEDDGYTASWGSGQTLGVKSDDPKKKTFTQDENISVPMEAKKQDNQIPRLPISTPCQLRIRLPCSGNKSVLETFDSNERLSVIYHCLKSHVSELSVASKSTTPRLVQLQGFTNNEGKQAVGVYGGAFANPFSEYGFTLLSVHPKREFSLEMHGSMSLKDLGLTPSATLTMMKTGERGQIKRGDLESKLGEAQGDAMDVEGLGYEALQELGEKIGIAAPGDGTWKGVDESTLREISTEISPMDYLNQKSGQQENETKCPICLGEFDTIDATLLQLKNCGHTFHKACLLTWLATKTNCPVCKCSLS